MEIPFYPLEKDKTPGDKARRRYLAGYSCAEAIIQGMRDHGIIHCTDEVLRAASGFSGGVGDSRQGMCGALSAGVIALGCLYGRATFGAELDPCAQRAARLVQRFKEVRGSDLCKNLIERFDPSDRQVFYGRERIMHCAEIVKEAGNLAAEIAVWKASQER